MMDYIIISNDPSLIEQIQPYKNVFAMVDIESIGKQDRQPASSFFSTHSIEDLSILKRTLDSDRIILRINPIHSASSSEIEKALVLGAGNIMLPMFSSENHIEQFKKLVNNRAKHLFLAETPWSVENAASYLPNLPTNSQIHFGLNDLHIALKYPHLFKVLSSGYLESAIEACKKNHVPFGIGGIGLGKKDAVSPKLIASYHRITGSSTVILSRSFKARAEEIGFDIAFDEIQKTFKDAKPNNIEDIKTKIQQSI